MHGKHVGHKCELVANIATTTREELCSVFKKLDDHYELIKKSGRKLVDMKDSILNTQHYLQDRIGKHMALLQASMSIGETALKRDVYDKTNEKTVPLDAQERY